MDWTVACSKEDCRPVAVCSSSGIAANWYTAASWQLTTCLSQSTWNITSPQCASLSESMPRVVLGDYCFQYVSCIPSQTLPGLLPRRLNGKLRTFFSSVIAFDMLFFPLVYLLMLNSMYDIGVQGSAVADKPAQCTASWRTCAPLPSNRHHRSCGDRPEGKGENYQVCSVQYCVQQLCTVRCTHIWTD